MKLFIFALLAMNLARASDLEFISAHKNEFVGSAVKGKTDIESAKVTGAQSKKKAINQAEPQRTFVFYFASWCGYCEAAAPIVQRTFEKVKDCPVQFIGIAGDNDSSAVEKIKDKWKFTFPIVHDGERNWLQHFGIHQIPRAILIDQTDHRLVDNSGVETVQRAMDQLVSWSKSQNCYR
jgi:thiol-disulfide isomerase/thioredoxin